jgi:hypothetical protein
MKKLNRSEKKNRKMSTTTAHKVYKTPVSALVSDWVINTLSSSLSDEQIETLRKVFESKQGDLDNILSANTNVKSTGKRLKDPNAPKRGKSSYIFFCLENREKIKKSHPDMSAKDIIKELGRSWRDTSDEKKQKYVKLSEDDKERYSGEINEYIPSENFTKDKKKKSKRDGPKRSLTSYIFFCKEQRAVLKEKQPKLSTKELTSELGKRWKELSDAQKVPYVKLADNDKSRYDSEKTSWVDSEKAPEKEIVHEKAGKDKKSKKAGKDKKSKKAGKDKKSKKAGKDKKAGAGYVLFCEEERVILKEEHPDWSSQQLTKELRNAWTDLNQDEQNSYNERAEDDMVSESEEQ